MQLTPNFRLRKPDGTDPVDVKDLNDNMDVLDTEVAKKMDKTGDASNAVAKFSQAGSRTNLLSGEKISLSLGKIMKWFADLKDVAFSGSYSDLSGKPSIPSGTAASCGVANNDTTTASGFVADARIVKIHGDEIDKVNQNLGGLHLTAEGSGATTKYYAQLGADTASKKLLGRPEYKSLSMYNNSASGVRSLALNFTISKPDVLYVLSAVKNPNAQAGSNEVITLAMNNITLKSYTAYRPARGSVETQDFIQFEENIGENVSFILRNNSSDENAISLQAIAIYYN